jgi:hypothetical protein
MGRGRIRDRSRRVIRAGAGALALTVALACGAPELREPVALSLLALGDHFYDFGMRGDELAARVRGE